MNEEENFQNLVQFKVFSLSLNPYTKIADILKDFIFLQKTKVSNI